MNKHKWHLIVGGETHRLYTHAKAPAILSLEIRPLFCKFDAEYMVHRREDTYEIISGIYCGDHSSIEKLLHMTSVMADVWHAMNGESNEEKS